MAEAANEMNDLISKFQVVADLKADRDSLNAEVKDLREKLQAQVKLNADLQAQHQAKIADIGASADAQIKEAKAAADALSTAAHEEAQRLVALEQSTRIDLAAVLNNALAMVNESPDARAKRADNQAKKAALLAEAAKLG